METKITESPYSLFTDVNKPAEFQKCLSCCQFLLGSFKCLKSWPGTSYLNTVLEFYSQTLVLVFCFLSDETSISKLNRIEGCG